MITREGLILSIVLNELSVANEAIISTILKFYLQRIYDDYDDQDDFIRTYPRVDKCLRTVLQK